MNNIHKGKFKREHNWLITSIYNKETYNNFMSERVLLFPYVIRGDNKVLNEDRLDYWTVAYLMLKRYFYYFQTVLCLVTVE